MSHINIVDSATVLVFNKDEGYKARCAQDGLDAHLALSSVIEFLRRKVNKGEHSYKDADEALQSVWGFIHDEVESRKLDLEG